MGNGGDGDELPQGKNVLHITRTLGTEVLNYDVKLVTTDDKKTVIAEFHRRHYLVKKQKARLDIQPAGMDMLDYIVLTFVFAERKRRERERRAQHGGGGGP